MSGINSPLSGRFPMPEQASESGTRAQNQSSPNARSFQDVMRQNRATQAEASSAQAQAITPAQTEQMRADLTKRLANAPAARPGEILLPERIDIRTRMTMLRQALAEANASAPQNNDLRGRLSSMESEWNNIDKIMNSNRSMSQTELLSLQARMYQLSQSIEVMSKVIDQVTGGIKTVLNTNV